MLCAYMCVRVCVTDIKMPRKRLKHIRNQPIKGILLIQLKN